MGAGESKIDDRQRAKTFKRVSLIEARRQFAKVSGPSVLGVKNPLHKKLDSLPVSQNFGSYFREETNAKFGKGLVLYLESSGGVDLDSAKFQRCTLYHLLQTDYGGEYKVRTLPKDIPENYTIGLYKEQYDALYLTDSSVTETAPTPASTS